MTETTNRPLNPLPARRPSLAELAALAADRKASELDRYGLAVEAERARQTARTLRS